MQQKIRLPTAWLSKIGDTPLLKLEHDGIYAKLEGENPGGSHKDRAIAEMFLRMLAKTSLQRHHQGSQSLSSSSLSPTVMLVTSGSAGKSMALLHKAFTEANNRNDPTCCSGNICHLNIVVPLAYADKPVITGTMNIPGVRSFRGGFCEYFSKTSSAQQTSSINIIFENGGFAETMAVANEVAHDRHWIVADQHHDVSCMHGHATTAREIAKELPGVTDVVCATGTGAMTGGLRRYLEPHVLVHSRPAHSGTIDGLTDIRNYDNYCNHNLLHGYETNFFSPQDAKVGQDLLWSKYAIKAGQSSGACYMLARDLKIESPDRTVAFICANGTRARPFHGHSRGKELRCSSTIGRRKFSSSATQTSKTHVDNIVLGGGPIGTATAWKLAEKIADQGVNQSVMLVHNPCNHGAHEDWSRLARLSFDGTQDELELSRHAVELLKLVDEVRSHHSGPPVIPMSPGMLFLASPGTELAEACLYAEHSYGDSTFVRRDATELHIVYPGNQFRLPPDTLCWSHPTGLCVSPIELCESIHCRNLRACFFVVSPALLCLIC